MQKRDLVIFSLLLISILIISGCQSAVGGVRSGNTRVASVAEQTAPATKTIDRYVVYKEDETPNSIGDNLYLVEVNCPRSNNYYIENVMCMPDIRADIALIGLGIDPSSSVSSTQASCIFRADSPFKVAVHAQCARYDTPLRLERPN